MANAVSTAGMNVLWAVETVAGTRPSSGYTIIPGCKAIPALFNDPNTLQTTPLSAKKNHTYIEGLGDSGGSISITVNDYSEFRTAWNACVTAYGGLSGGKAMWFEIAYPLGSGLDSFSFVSLLILNLLITLGAVFKPPRSFLYALVTVGVANR